MWLTLSYQYLSIWACLCWEQENDSEQDQTNCTREVRWMSPALGAIILSYERVVTGVALTVPTTRITGALSGTP